MKHLLNKNISDYLAMICLPVVALGEDVGKWRCPLVEEFLSEMTALDLVALLRMIWFQNCSLILYISINKSFYQVFQKVHSVKAH